MTPSRYTIKPLDESTWDAFAALLPRSPLHIREDRVRQGPQDRQTPLGRGQRRHAVERSLTATPPMRLVRHPAARSRPSSPTSGLEAALRHRTLIGRQPRPPTDP
jgi:hypothetical protein